ncbi:MAG: PilX N-terminal domain-containing pilus assembly protein [Candidatus Competibacterales bacterium]
MKKHFYTSLRRHCPCRLDPRRRQRGIGTLAICLILLGVITLLGVTAMQSNTVDQRIVGNQWDRNRAFLAAEAALNAGEDFLKTLIAEPKFCDEIDIGDCKVLAPNRYITASANIYNWSSQDWKNALIGGSGSDWAYEFNEAPFDAVNATYNPYYSIVEQQFVPEEVSLDPSTYGTKPGLIYYRITSESSGANDQTQVVLQSIFTWAY